MIGRRRGNIKHKKFKSLKINFQGFKLKKITFYKFKMSYLDDIINLHFIEF